MKALKLLSVALVTGIVGLGGLELGERLSGGIDVSLVREAQAIVGRPVTPVSVAGVGRRTVRRCAAGVYC